MQTFVLTLLAMVAFAGNSILCRLALGGGDIEPMSFTVIRLLSGSFTLVALLALARAKSPVATGQRFWAGSWGASFALLAYALCFSLAYVRLGTAEGALILFATVQLATLCASFIVARAVRLKEVAGMALAFTGVAVLLLPKAARPEWQGALLMVVAGLAWAIYSLMGKGAVYSLATTCGNFCRASLVIVAILLPWLTQMEKVTIFGGLLALSSGVFTSAIGYAIWYRALKNLSINQSGVVQLSVPVLAALGGVLFVGESIPILLWVAMAAVLLGIGLTISSVKVT